MPDELRIAVDELPGRMEAGEDFAFVDVRNPRAWGRIGEASGSDTHPTRSGRAGPEQGSARQIHSGVLHLTERAFKRQFGANASATGIQECLGTQRRARCLDCGGFAAGSEAESGLATPSSGALGAVVLAFSVAVAPGTAAGTMALPFCT
jgi:hypothetical protein